jgi:hypothetical protein
MMVIGFESSEQAVNRSAQFSKIRWRVFCCGQIWSSVSPSNNSPFFITYLMALVLRMSSNEFPVGTIKSASFPTSMLPKSWA